MAAVIHIRLGIPIYSGIIGPSGANNKGDKYMRVLSGIQPSGGLHLGNYFGMMQRMIQYQEEEELFCFIVNLHALTSVFDGEALRTNTINAATDFLALGLDPEKSYFWVQSDVPGHMELTWYLSNFTPVGLLQRAHSYKDKIAKGLAPNSGLFTYPILMAADILLYNAEKIPVGKDQKQHVEMARDIALKFNNTYGEVFTVPEVEINQDVATVPGTDGQKMSKSYDNTILIFEEYKKLKKKVMGFKTDSKTVEEPKAPEECNLFALYKLFAGQSEIDDLADRYRAGGLGYGTVKKELLELIWNYFEPYRQRRQDLLDDPGQVLDILKAGAEKTNAVAEETMTKIRKLNGINYRA
jgi:tryptophanyl-tRNA synthetase